MSTATLRRTRVFPRDKLLTAADLAELPTNLPSGTVSYELHGGRLIVMAPPGDFHGAVQSNLGYEIKRQGEKRGLGKARTEVGVVLWRDPDTVRGPDVAFVANASLPLRRSPEGYLETIPDLVVEVVSKNDEPAEVEAAVREYLKAGVGVIWIVDPKTRSVTEHRRKRKARVYTEADFLTVEDVIPGFQMHVKDVFEE
jgi:Uma2 family endonuclease